MADSGLSCTAFLWTVSTRLWERAGFAIKERRVHLVTGQARYANDMARDSYRSAVQARRLHAGRRASYTRRSRPAIVARTPGVLSAAPMRRTMSSPGSTQSKARSGAVAGCGSRAEQVTALPHPVVTLLPLSSASS